jgi:hypothetical protein
VGGQRACPYPVDFLKAVFLLPTPLALQACWPLTVNSFGQTDNVHY